MEERCLTLPERLWSGVGPRGGVDCNAFAPKHPLYPEHVVSIAHGKAGIHAIGAHDVGNASGRCSSVRALRLRNHLSIRNTQGTQVLATDSSFCKPRIL